MPLTIKVPEGEYWDEKNNRFITVKAVTLELEHSLISVSKWEAKWQKPFLGDKVERTDEQTFDYIKDMTLTRNVPDDVYRVISQTQLDIIADYISAPMTATTFSSNGISRANQKIVTSEVIYYWMVALTIPFECQKWHLNRLLTLIRVCNEKNKPPTKMSRQQILQQQRALNEKRRAELGTRG